MCECPVFAIGKTERRVVAGQRFGIGERCEEEKASFAARFWSTVLAMSYHCAGLASEGLPAAIVATIF